MSLTTTGRKKARWITAVFFFVSGIITSTWASRIPDVQHNLALNDAQWGVVLFAMPVGLITGLPLSSWMVSRFGTRLMMFVSMFSFAAILCLLPALAHSWQLMLALFCFGLSRNLVNISNNSFAIEVQQLYDKPIMSTFHGLWSLACFLGAGIGTLMITHNIIPLWHFITIAVVVMTVSIIYKGKANKKESSTLERRPFFIPPDRYLFLLGMITFCAMICESTMFDWSVNYFKQIIQAGKEKVTVGYTAFIMAMSFGRLIGDKIIARFGVITMLIANGLLMATGFTLAVSLPYLLPATAGFLLVGLGDSIVIPLVYTLASKSAKMPPAYAIASVTLIGYMGFLTGPLIIGSISNAIGMQWSFALMGLLTLLISFLALQVKSFIQPIEKPAT